MDDLPEGFELQTVQFRMTEDGRLWLVIPDETEAVVIYLSKEIAAEWASTLLSYATGALVPEPNVVPDFIPDWME